MKIIVAICTTDTQYSERVSFYCQKHYYDKFSWNLFSDISYLAEFVERQAVDLILVGREMEEAASALAEKTGGESVWVSLVDDPDDEVPKDFSKIQKYARIDRIYRDLLEVYSGKEHIHYRSAAIANDKTTIIAFVSASGGVGTSTLAVAAAKYYARMEKVLYVNLENIGVVRPVFAREKNVGMDEVIYTLKSRRKALELKLESAVSMDKSGVYFFEMGENPLDVISLTSEDMKELLMAAQQTKEYDRVILDVGNGLGEKDIACMTFAGRIVVTLEDSELAKDKLERYLKALQAVENMRKVDICSKMLLAYNKVLKQWELPESLFQVRVAGSFPKLENGTYDGIIARLSSMEMIHNLK